AVSVGALVPTLAQRVAAPPPGSALVKTVVQAACASDLARARARGLVASNVVALSQGVLRSMFLTKLKVSVVILLGACFLGGGALLCYQAQAGPSTEFTSVEAWPGEHGASPAPQAPATPPAGQAKAPKQFDNAPGWHWLLAPCPPRDKSDKLMVYLLDRDAEG